MMATKAKRIAGQVLPWRSLLQRSTASPGGVLYEYGPGFVVRYRRYFYFCLRAILAVSPALQLQA
jgi:hypothetical protein